MSSATVVAAPDTPNPVRHNRIDATVAGVLTSGLGVVGVVVGGIGLFGAPGPVRVGWLLPLSGVYFDPDPVGGFFMALTGAVAIPVGVYAVGYAQREHLGRVTLWVLPVFVAAMGLVPAAGAVTTFLLLWELMAIASLVLVLAEHRRAPVRAAGVFYAVMTQLGFAAILLGLLTAAAAAGADRFSEFSGLPDTTRPIVFVLTVAGFGSKAGLVPLHAWLPRAHPEAPSPVSALMSAAMVNLGIYGIVRFDILLFGPAPSWWGLALLIVGGVTAVYGVLQASVATDLKRLLAFSTTENMGLIVLALGAAVLLVDAGARSAATVATAAALLHLLAHAVFKCLGFLAAGSVLAATGLRDLDRLGGLARRMPVTTAVFGIAALGASGLPLGAGFVSEWLIVQSLIHAGTQRDSVVALAAPLAVGAVALTAGLGVATMVKAFGVGFLARPRSQAAAEAREAPVSMRAAMVIAAGGCVVLGVAPLVAGPVLGRVLVELPVSREVRFDLAATVHLPGLSGSIAPGVIAVALVVAVAVALALTRWRVARRPVTKTLPLWACGADQPNVRMQYTATSFAEPMQRVFDDVLRPDTDIEITHLAESRYLVDKVAYRARITDTIEQRLYRPVTRAIRIAALVVARGHTGSVHLYLAYGAVGVLIAVLVSR
ncbi:proton-conducting transporter membrane subunit [Nocardia vinacea]|uniref:proton-conducting transporter transmembrane domain-containing protein n=1 Tax=Nocardia vinacea TaxID=96468 RepID=UPI0034182634